MVIFLGCDLQQPELTFKEKIPFSACHNCTQNYKDFVGCIPEKKIIRTRKIEGIADIIVSHIAFSDCLKREYLNIVQPINLEDFPSPALKTKNIIPVILHAPSNPGYKGTKYLLDAVEKLKTKFEFELKLVTNVSINQLYEKISKADLIVDQLIQGWYGLLPLEAMMLEKPVVCYLREDVINILPEKCPIIISNPSNIFSVLKYQLENQHLWPEIGKQGRNFVMNNHDARKVAKHYSTLLLN